jgi:hypothetical protein
VINVLSQANKMLTSNLSWDTSPDLALPGHARSAEPSGRNAAQASLHMHFKLKAE